MTNLADPAGESGGLVEGLGPLQVLAAEVGADNEATRFVGALLANGAQPGLVVHTTATMRTQADVDLVKAAARQEFGGIRRGSVAVLDGSSTLTQTGFNLQQLEFPSLRKVAESRISASLGVPAILVGLQVGLESGIRATIAEQREYFAETTLSAYWRRGQDSFGRDVAAEFETDAVCLFDMKKVKALAEQSKNEVNKIAQGFTAGAVSFDEYRVKVLGLPPLGIANGGGHRVLPRGTIEVDENGNVVEDNGVPLAAATALALQAAEQSAKGPPPPAPGVGEPIKPGIPSANGHGTKPKQEVAA
jgi:HK97 family phage portal protein